MFRWLQKKITNLATDAQRDDLNRFYESLRGMDDESIASLVAWATCVRINMEDNRIIPQGMWSHYDFPFELDTVKIAVTFDHLVQDFQKAGKLHDAAAVMVWWHSMRAITTLELRWLGKQIWKELMRGFKGASGAAWDLKTQGFIKNIPPRALSEFEFVPPALRE